MVTFFLANNRIPGILLYFGNFFVHIREKLSKTDLSLWHTALASDIFHADSFKAAPVECVCLEIGNFLTDHGYREFPLMLPETVLIAKGVNPHHLISVTKGEAGGRLVLW